MKRNLIYYYVKRVATFVSDTKGDAIYKDVCRTVTQNLLRGSIIAYFLKGLHYDIEPS